MMILGYFAALGLVLLLIEAARRQERRWL